MRFLFLLGKVFRAINNNVIDLRKSNEELHCKCEHLLCGTRSISLHQLTLVPLPLGKGGIVSCKI